MAWRWTHNAAFVRCNLVRRVCCSKQLICFHRSRRTRVAASPAIPHCFLLLVPVCRDSCCGLWQWRWWRTRRCPSRSTPSSIEWTQNGYVLQHADALHLPHVAKELEEDRFDVGIGVVKAGDEQERVTLPHHVELSTGHVPRDLRVLQRVEAMHNLPVVVLGEVADRGAGVTAHGIHVVGGGEAHVHRVPAELHSVHDECFGRLGGLRKLDERL